MPVARCNVQKNGLEIVRSGVPKSLVQRLILEVETSADTEGVLSADRISTFWRMLPSLRIALASLEHRLQHLLEARPLVTQAVLLDKHVRGNWSLPMHQDIYLRVRNKMSEHLPPRRVRPPVDILRSMLVMRLHLDDCLAVSGGLRIVPGTHLTVHRGFMPESKLLTLNLRSGDVLLMRPLLVHDSPPSTVAKLRRVVHLSFIPRRLKAALAWHDCFDPWRITAR